MKAAREGWFEIDQSNPKMRSMDESERKLAEKLKSRKRSRSTKLLDLLFQNLLKLSKFGIFSNIRYNRERKLVKLCR